MQLPRRQHTARLNVALAIMLMLAPGCRSTPPVQDAEVGAALLFVNESLDNAEVFAVARGASQVQLGVVMQGERQMFELPARLLRQGSNLNIVARTQTRARSISSGPINATSGKVLQVTLPLAGTHLIIETGRQ